MKYVLEPRQQYMTLAGEHRFKVGMKTKIADNSEKGIGDNQMNNILADLAGSFLGGRGGAMLRPSIASFEGAQIQGMTDDNAGPEQEMQAVFNSSGFGARSSGPAVAAIADSKPAAPVLAMKGGILLFRYVALRPLCVRVLFCS